MYLFGTVINDNGSETVNATTLVYDLTANENGLIFFAQSYHQAISEIHQGRTIPFRSWSYFCQASETDNLTTAYSYLLTQDTFANNQLID